MRDPGDIERAGRESGAGSSGRGRVGVLTLLLRGAAGFALALGVWLGVAGLRTSGFALAVTPAQTLPLLGAAFASYLVLGLLVLLVSLRAIRRGSGERVIELRLHHSMATLTLWALLTVMFLPLKGSESFVRAGELTTLQLNAVGLALVLVVGWVGGLIISRVAATVLRPLRRRLSHTALGSLGVSLAAISLIVLIAGSAARTAGASSLAGLPGGATADAPRVAVIGIDGCDWEKLGPLVESGRLPTFRKLIDSGAHGPLRSSIPLVSPRIWTTIATGKTPEKHGIHDFVNDSGVPVNATMRTASTLWDIASGTGHRVGVVGWYVTWPVDELNGFVLSDRIHTLLRGPVQMLQSAAGRPTNERLEAFGEFEFDPGYKSYAVNTLEYQQNRIVDEPLRWGYLRDAIYTRLATALIPAYRPTLSAVYLRGVDFVQHFFWKYSDPEPFGDVTPDEERAYGGVIADYYCYTDVLLGRLLTALGEDVNVLIVSDHGFKARIDLDPNRPQLTGTHDIDGVFIASGPAFRAAGRFDGATIFDIAPTALAVMGLPVPDDMDGRVLDELIREEHLAAHPISSIPSYEPAVGRDRGEIGSTMDESIRDQLRSLGYIE